MLKKMSAIEEQLLKIKHEAEEREAKRKAERSGFDYLDINLAPVEVDALKLMPEAEARQLRVSPIQLKAQNLVLAVFDPEQEGVRNLLKQLESRGFIVKIYIVSLRSLEQAWSAYQYIVSRAAAITSRIEIAPVDLAELTKKLVDFKAVAEAIREFDFSVTPTAKILEIVLAGALANRASDIHWEPEAAKVKIRFRVDGLLHDVTGDLERSIYSQILNRLKLLSNLKLNIQGEPQDGRFTIGLPEGEIEIRVSVVPSEFGETAVLRVLDPRMIEIGLEDLGLREDDLAIIKEELLQPNGMILNTGPTGSGKTTTLYSFLRAKSSPEVKIITIEDPIEYHLAGVEQTQVNERSGYTFANGLRSLMRQDPDVILIGEIRDRDTAETAIQAALTGHLVFSTVHANSAAGAIPRLLDLDIKPASIGPALNLIIAQRLVKKLCDYCKKEMIISVELEKQLTDFINQLPPRVRREQFLKKHVFQATGCSRCNNLGYWGRVAIFELLRVETAIETFINKESGEAALARLASEQGMVTMQQDGVLKFISGITTLEEVAAVTGPIHW